jgi:hypothetical protein
MTSQTVHCSFVSQAGARARLVKSSYQGFICEKIGILAIPGKGCQPITYLKYPKVFLSTKIFE